MRCFFLIYNERSFKTKLICKKTRWAFFRYTIKNKKRKMTYGRSADWPPVADIEGWRACTRQEFHLHLQRAPMAPHATMTVVPADRPMRMQMLCRAAWSPCRGHRGPPPPPQWSALATAGRCGRCHRRPRLDLTGAPPPVVGLAHNPAGVGCELGGLDLFIGVPRKGGSPRPRLWRRLRRQVDDSRLLATTHDGLRGSI